MEIEFEELEAAAAEDDLAAEQEADAAKTTAVCSVEVKVAP